MSKGYVSVPYRGATFLNLMPVDGLRSLICVSVPYRGATFLNTDTPLSAIQLSLCFRPLSGSYISQLICDILYILVFIVSVPYRGATFLN